MNILKRRSSLDLFEPPTLKLLFNKMKVIADLETSSSQSNMMFIDAMNFYLAALNVIIHLFKATFILM